RFYLFRNTSGADNPDGSVIVRIVGNLDTILEIDSGFPTSSAAPAAAERPQNPDESVALLARIRDGEGKTTPLAADHSAYHLGKFITVRRILGASSRAQFQT